MNNIKLDLSYKAFMYPFLFYTNDVNPTCLGMLFWAHVS